MHDKFRWIATILSAFLLNQMLVFSQIQDDFTDGNFNQDPTWLGETDDFKITNSSAIPIEMKPALQLDASDSDTSVLILPNTLINNTEWRFWAKLSFNTSANNFARIYLVSDQADLKGPLNGYFLQIGGTNDSLTLYRQQGFDTDMVIKGITAYTGNSTNVMRVKVSRDNDGLWKLFVDQEGGNNLLPEGEGFDNNINGSAYFGIYCKYTSSNATKFYWDDFFVGEIIIDTIPPQLMSIEVLEPDQLIVGFSEAVDLASGELLTNYLVNNTIGNPIEAVRDETDFSIVRLTFNNSFEVGVNYQLNVTQVSDLVGNIMGTDNLGFMILAVQDIPPFSVLINELMVDENPPPDSLPEADYLELYNTTSEPINLENFTIKPRISSDPISFPAVVIEPDSFLIVVTTADVEDFETYGAVVGLPGFSLNNEGRAVLRNASGTLMHAVEYDDSWYQDDSKKDGGWSLEQVDPWQACTGKINWRATVSSQHGTPGHRNSVDGVTFSNPTMMQAIAIDENSLLLSFNHWMDSLALVNTSVFSVDNGIGAPILISVADLAFDQVTLEFTTAFEKNVVYELLLMDSLPDCNGHNIPAGESVSFVLPNEAAPFEIVFNELMPDPDPPVGIPEFEFIELFNTTDSYLSMKGWSLVVGTSEKLIPDLVIGPQEYIILTVEEAQNLMGMFGRAFGMSSLGLTNSGAALKLINDAGQTMAAVIYSDDWYGDSDKADGGWSLEQIDPFNPCSGKENWTVSLNNAGGTPGAINSVDAENTLPPILQKVIVAGDQLLDVSFSQYMDGAGLLDQLAYEVDKGIGNPTLVTLMDSLHQNVRLTFNEAFIAGIVYTLSVANTISNCAGMEVLPGTEMIFGVAEAASTQDVVINEVLFNPAGEGVDFIEIYNRSSKILNIWELQLGHVKVDPFGHPDTTYKVVSDDDALLLSGEYLVLTTDPDKVKDQYYTSNEEGFIRMESFPSYSNESGTVVLANRGGRRLDVFEYHEDMHYPLLNSDEGVSLERIHFDRPSNDPTNWHSAASSVGYATPAYQNSQFATNESADDEVSLDPEIFSPNNDGYNDVLNIRYQFATPGFSATILIFDSNGRQVRTLINHELLGTSGSFSWDGRTDDNQKASIGIYIIYFEAFDMVGGVKKYKKTAVLGG